MQTSNVSLMLSRSSPSYSRSSPFYMVWRTGTSWARF